ncbi:MAG: hypothetical protein OXE77_05440 [Flavobacteriaceae bacterium]|nr:hypothetical protein [Flavobacteriaceae bacterium]
MGPKKPEQIRLKRGTIVKESLQSSVEWEVLDIKMTSYVDINTAEPMNSFEVQIRNLKTQEIHYFRYPEEIKYLDDDIIMIGGRMIEIRSGILFLKKNL